MKMTVSRITLARHAVSQQADSFSDDMELESGPAYPRRQPAGPTGLLSQLLHGGMGGMGGMGGFNGFSRSAPPRYGIPGIAVTASAC